MKQLIILLLINIGLTSCEKHTQKIDYIKPNENKEQAINNTKNVLISDLPVNFENNDSLIFPIRLADLGTNKSSKLASYSSDSGNAGNYSGMDFISGHFVNFTFQDRKGKQLKLTEKNLNITNLTFLREIFKNTKKKYLLYILNDRDTNNDQEINYKDLKSLYISKSNGTEFKKLTKEKHEFYDNKVIKAENKVYFRTLEDINKDGELNNDDKFHYYYIDFNNSDYRVIEHNPLKLY